MGLNYWWGFWSFYGVMILISIPGLIIIFAWLIKLIKNSVLAIVRRKERYNPKLLRKNTKYILTQTKKRNKVV